MSRLAILLRACLLLLGTAGLVVLSWTLVWDMATTSIATVTAGLGGPSGGPTSATLPALLTGSSAVVALVVSSWLALSVSLTTAAALRQAPHRPLPRVLSPRIAVALVGSLLGSGIAGHPAAATGTGAGTGADGRADPRSAALSGLPLPDRPAGPGDRDRPRGHTVTVAPGDSLWRISQRLLPATARAVELDRTWRNLYDANRRALGADPDLIHPGTPLRLPDHLVDTPGAHP